MTSHEMHPFVHTLLQQLQTDEVRGTASLLEAEFHRATVALREETDTQVFLDLVVVWQRLQTASLYLATDQFLDLAAILLDVHPELRAVSERGARAVLDGRVMMHHASGGLEPKVSMGGVGMRKHGAR